MAPHTITHQLSYPVSRKQRLLEYLEVPAQDRQIEEEQINKDEEINIEVPSFPTNKRKRSISDDINVDDNESSSSTAKRRKEGGIPEVIQQHCDHNYAIPLHRQHDPVEIQHNDVPLVEDPVKVKTQPNPINLSIPVMRESPENSPVRPSISPNLMPHSTPGVNNSSVDPVHQFPNNPTSNPDIVIIGPGGTIVSKDVYRRINWSLSPAIITRKLLMEIFGREILSTHSLSGRPSPAFLKLDKPLKEPLDPLKVSDIILLVTALKNVSAKEVRMAITGKCADEQKMAKARTKKVKKVNNN